MRNIVQTTKEFVGDDYIDHGKEWIVFAFLKTMHSEFIITCNVNIVTFIFQTLEAFSSLGNRIDTVGMYEHAQLFRQYVLGPNVVDSNGHFCVVHCIDLNHILIVITHLDVAAILLNEFRSVVTIGQQESRSARDSRFDCRRCGRTRRGSSRWRRRRRSRWISRWACCGACRRR